MLFVQHWLKREGNLGHSVSLKSESLESSSFITFTWWKNLLFFIMAILPYLGSRQRNSPDALVVPTELQTGLWRSDLSQWIEERTPGLDQHPQTGIGTLLIGLPAAQCSLHKEERVSKVLLRITGRGTWRDSPWTPLCRQPHGLCHLRHFYKWLNKFTKGGGHWLQACSPINSRMTEWGSCDEK